MTETKPLPPPNALVLTSGQPSVWTYANPWTMLRGLWRQRQLINQLTRRELGTRYKATNLGMIWTVIQPLFMLSIYFFVFGIVLWDPLRKDSKLEFVLSLYCGLILYYVFSEAVMQATGVIIANPNYIKKVIFPVEVLPVVGMSASLFQALINSIVLMLGIFIFSKPSWTMIYLPLVLLPLCAFTIGLGWLFAALGVFIRDIGQTVALLVQVLIFATPVFYDMSRIPDKYHWIMKINPLTQIVTDGRRVLVKDMMPEWGSWAVVTLITLVIMQVGYMFFMRSKRAFGDVI